MPVAEPQPPVGQDRIVEAADEAAGHLDEQRKNLPARMRGTLVFGIASIVGAAALMAWALVKARNVPMAAGAIAFGGFGYVCVALALGWDRRELRRGYYALLAAVLLVLNWYALAASLDALRSVQIAGMNGQVLAGIACAALDLYVIAMLCRGLGRQALGATPTRPRRLLYVGASVAAAFALHFTGALNAMYNGLGLTPPGPVASSGRLTVERQGRSAPYFALGAFGGNWSRQDRRPPPKARIGLDWIVRAELAVAEGKANARLWRTCPAKECDAGSFPAIVESHQQGSAQVLHVTGRTDGVDWIASFTPGGEFLRMREQQQRGANYAHYNSETLRRH